MSAWTRAIFLGPLICGLLGEARAPLFISLVGVAAFAIAARLRWPAPSP